MITTKETPPLQTTYITTTSAPLPPQTTYVEVINTPRPQNPQWRYKQKGDTVMAGMLLFIYGGMDMAQGLGWNLLSGIETTQQFQFSWFIGIIIGAVVAALTVTHAPKWFFYSLGGLMQLIDAIIFVSAPNDYTPIVAARYVGGVGIGLITVAFIIHNSEANSCGSRGNLCGLEQYGFALGIIVQVIMDSVMDIYSSIGVNRVHGIFGIVLSVVATGLVTISVESPIFFLRKNNEDMARTCQRRLMSNLAPTGNFNQVFDEAKLYVAEGNSQSIAAQCSSSIMPFIKMLFSRCLVAFTFSIPLSITMKLSTVVSPGGLDWPIYLWCILRWIGATLSLFLLDKLGRKFVSLLGLLCMAGLMLGMAGILSDLDLSDISGLVYYMNQLCRISMVFQFFAGLFISCTPTYLGEAFPMKVKALLIGLIVCIEQVIHIIVIATFDGSFFQYFLAVGIILVVSLIIFGALMPETRGLSLRQAGERFRRVHDVMAH